MKRLELIRNPEVFQGEKFLKEKKNYFEGWYFKNTSNVENISFIPGINIDEKDKKAFIQVITNKESFFINYDIKDFKYCHNPFYIKIGNNYFSKEKIDINIKDNKQNIKINGNLKYSNSKNIIRNKCNPNIMGPFSYVPFMECNHAILCMKNIVEGSIKINDKKIVFDKGIGYIEKDWGISFPKSYIWCQGNCFKKSNASFMLSIADVPFKCFSFRGLICVLNVNDIEYRFTTYNNSKILKYNINGNLIDIILKHKSYYLNIKSEYNKGNKLFAPVKGKMEKGVFESIQEKISVILKEDDNIIFSDISSNCGIEIA